MGTQVGFFEAILNLLYLKPHFLIGFAALGLLLYWIFRKDQALPKIKITISAMLMYYYLCIVFWHIVGLPTLSEFFRLSSLGEKFFNPNLSLIPFIDGIGLDTILNIMCFMPLGFLSPMISRSYEKTKKVILLGFGVSFLIEISQLFTMFRATDITDLITNVLGAVVGYLCFKLVVKLRIIKLRSGNGNSLEKDETNYLPVLVVVVALMTTFIFG